MFARIAQNADRAIRPHLGSALFYVVGLTLLLSCASVVHETLQRLVQLRDVGYPDSATLLVVNHFLDAGILYRDISQPPYHLTLYGPLFYMLLSPAQALSSLLGLETAVLVRGVVTASWCLSLAGVFSITRKISKDSSAAWLAVLFAAAPLPMVSWTAQVRGDLVALALCLWGVRLALSANRPARLAAAGACVGSAVLVKLTFVAAPAAVALWLNCERRFKDLQYWVASVGIAAAVGYAVVYWREPLLLDHLAGLRGLMMDPQGAVLIALEAIEQPVTPFAVGGLVAYWVGRAPGHLGVLFYSVIAWAIALATIPQVGGNINYFEEAWFISAVPAGIVVSQSRKGMLAVPPAVTVLLLAIAAWFSVLTLRGSIQLVRPYFNAEFANRSETEDRWKELMSALSGAKLLSTMPEIANVSRDPEVPDPFLNSTLEAGGVWSYEPVATKLRAGAYDAVVIRTAEAEEAAPYPGFRGIRLWSPSVWSSLRATYQRHCVIETDRIEVWLPPSPDRALVERLNAIRCLGGP